MTKMINCYVCGSWLKPNKHGYYKCPKCKSRYKLNEQGVPERIYENSEEQINE